MPVCDHVSETSNRTPLAENWGNALRLGLVGRLGIVTDTGVLYSVAGEHALSFFPTANQYVWPSANALKPNDADVTSTEVASAVMEGEILAVVQLDGSPLPVMDQTIVKPSPATVSTDQSSSILSPGQDGRSHMQ